MEMKVEKQFKRTVKAGLILFAAGLLLGAVIVYAVTPSSTFYISSGVYPGAPSFTVWEEDSDYFAKDANGQLKYSGTNATEIIQNCLTALTSGGTVFLKGSFEMDGFLEIGSNQKLVGEKNTLLKRTANTVVMIKNDNARSTGYTGNENIELSNFRIDVQGDTYTTYCTAIAFIHSMNIHVSNVEVYDVADQWHAIEFNSIRHGKIEGCYLHNDYDIAGTEAIQIDGASGGWVDADYTVDDTISRDIIICNNHIVDFKRGIGSHNVGSQDGINIHDNNIEGFTQHGIRTYEWDNSSIHDNCIHDNTPKATFSAPIAIRCYVGFRVSKNLLISNNEIYNIFAEYARGIYVTGNGTASKTQQVNIIGNNLFDIGEHGISCDNVTGIIYSANSLMNMSINSTTGYALTIYQSSNAAVTGNYVYGSEYGFWIYNSTNVQVKTCMFLGLRTNVATVSGSTHYEFADNFYDTANTGQTTLTNGQTSVSVTVGLITSESLVWLTIQEPDNLAAGEYLRVDTIYPIENRFTVECGDGGAASTNIIFNYKVEN